MLIDGIELTEESVAVNMQVASGTAFPASPSIGELYYLTAGMAGLYVYDGASWIAADGGTINESTINHDNIMNVGTNTHAQIDAHIADTVVHANDAVAASSNDTAPGSLFDKLVAGGNITFSVLNPGLNEQFQISTSPAVGEANTASNVGVGGVGIFKQKTTTDLEFKNINVGSNKLSVTDDVGNNEIDLDIVEANLVHDNIGGAGTNTHAQIDSHIGTGSIHFTVASIDHTLIQNIGTNTHAQIDTHIGDSTVHFTEASIDHTNILNKGTNTHAQIDSHISNSALHSDINAKVSATDTTTNYLESKIVAGANVTITKLNSGANEQLEIASTGGGPTTTVSTLDPSGGSDGDIWYKV